MRFSAGLVSLGLILVLAATAHGTSVEGILVDSSPVYTTKGSPSGYTVSPGTFYDGVADVIVQVGKNSYIRGSGALISGPNGDFILTAAHVVDHMIAGGSHVFFDLPGGRVGLAVAAAYVNPNWDSNYLDGNDIALIKLASPAPAGVVPYSLYRGNGEVDALGAKVGYGMSGSGNQGAVLDSGTKHAGHNEYDALADIFSDIYAANGRPRPLPGTQLAYDFDDGLAANDAFGFFFGLSDTGLPDEVGAAPGDSGSPTFINGQIAGVTSYGMRMVRVAADGSSSTSDINNILDSSFGEFAVDTRVSYYAGWIDSVIIPEPMTMAGLAIGIVSLARYVRRREAA